MRWMALLALATFLPSAPVFAQTPHPPVQKVPSSLPTPKAEPEHGEGYAPPRAPERQGPTDADRGPVQRKFILASTVDGIDPMTYEPVKDHDKIVLDKKIKIAKIHDIQNDGTGNNTGNNQALLFEIKYLNFGAVTQEQLLARRGHYFTTTWFNHGPKDDFTVYFEYRQVKSKEVVRTLSQKVNGASGSVRAYFAVVDKAYEAYGPVCSWRITIRKGDTVVAEAKSFIW